MSKTKNMKLKPWTLEESLRWADGISKDEPVKVLARAFRAQERHMNESLGLQRGQMLLIPHDHGSGVELLKVQDSDVGPFKINSVLLNKRDIAALRELFA